MLQIDRPHPDIMYIYIFQLCMLKRNVARCGLVTNSVVQRSNGYVWPLHLNFIIIGTFRAHRVYALESSSLILHFIRIF